MSILSAQTDYREYKSHEPRYRYVAIALNNAQASTVQFQATSSTQIEWRISGTTMFNPARSFIQYQMTIPAGGAGQYTFTQENGFDFRNCYFGDGSGAGLVDLNQLDYWVNLARPFMTEKAELDNRDRLSGFYPCRQPAANNILPYSKDGLTLGTDNGGNIDQTEQQYLNVQPTPNTAYAWNRYLPLTNLVNTALAIDKDLIFGQDMYLRFQTQYLQKMFAYTTTPAAPQSTYTLPTAAITVSNLYLFLAVEMNTNIITSLTSSWQGGKIRYSIPFVYPNRLPVAGGSSTASTTITLTKNYGRAVKRIVTALYQGNEFVPYWWDHSNYNGTKATTIQSVLNSATLQNYALNCYNPNSSINPAGTNINTVNYFGDDYREMLPFISRSALQNYACYQNNWFWMDAWGTQAQKSKTPLVEDQQIDDGYSLLNGANQIYTITFQTPAIAQNTSNCNTNGLILFCFVNFIRTLVINPTSYTLRD